MPACALSNEDLSSSDSTTADATPYEEMHGSSSSSDDDDSTGGGGDADDRRSLIRTRNNSPHSSSSPKTSDGAGGGGNYPQSYNMCSVLQSLVVLSAVFVLVNDFLSSGRRPPEPLLPDNMEASMKADVSQLRGPQTQTQAQTHPHNSTSQQQHQHPRRSFVCITGQLSRLEMQNKIATVLEPLRAAGLPPDIALIVDDTTTITTNDQRVDAEYHPAYSSFAEVVDELRSYQYRVLTGRPYHQPASVIVPPDYMKYLHQRESFDVNKTAERAANNLRMMESWDRCYVEMSRDIDRMASYEVVMRIREDTGFLRSIDFGKVRQELDDDPLAMINNGCRAWYDGTAMNDKFGITSKTSARAYFQLPYHNMYAAPISEEMKNTERYFYSTYTNAGYHVIRSDHIRDVVKLVSRAEDGTTMLFHQERKKLAKQCDLIVEDDSVPGACTFRWDEEVGSMTIDDDICWPSHAAAVPADDEEGEEPNGDTEDKESDISSSDNEDNDDDANSADR